MVVPLSVTAGDRMPLRTRRRALPSTFTTVVAVPVPPKVSWFASVVPARLLVAVMVPVARVWPLKNWMSAAGAADRGGGALPVRAGAPVSGDSGWSSS